MGVPAATTLDQTARGELARCLRDGLGVEDFAVRSGEDIEQARACVAYWRNTGILPRILEVDHRRNAEARQIMGCPR